MWLDFISPEKNHEFIQEVSNVLASIGGERCKVLNDLMLSRSFKEVIDYHFDYNSASECDYSDVKYARQIQALLLKQDWIDVGYDRKGTARAAFMAAEERCRVTNKRLDERVPRGTAASIMHRAGRKISAIIGQVPSLGSLDLSYGPGATTNVKSAIACFRSKLNASLTCSDEALPCIQELLEELPLLVGHHGHFDRDLGVFVGPLESPLDPAYRIVPVEVHQGKVQFVPKNCKTDRSIIVEPILNGLVQRGIGAFLKRKLLQSGIDLTDQSRNQRLAWRGSLDGSLATVDLKSASDCVSIALVFDLLGLDWASFLANWRTGTVTLDGQTIHLEKFSSMGNGFTFELESLIFYGLAFAVTDYLGLNTEEVSVYGDDIIVPAAAYSLLELMLSFCGFEVNDDKSFASGPFRESCGADWFYGLDIRPFYLKKRVNGQVLFAFHNWAIRNCERELAAVILKWIPDPIKLWGPDGFGDGHLIGSYSLRLNRTQRRAGWCGGFFDTYSLKGKSFTRLLPGDWMVPAYSVYTRSGESDPTDPNVVRGSRGYAKVSIYTLATSVFRRAARAS